MRKIFLVLIIIFTITLSYAQEKKDRLKLQDLPGAFIFDIGATHYQNAPGNMELKILGSKGANIYYTYDIKLIGEKFSFSPGVGIGITNYLFKNPVTFGYDTIKNTLQVINIGNKYKGLKKTKLQANYLDIPLEFRFRTSKDVNSFKFAVGANFGVLIASHTKVKYKDDGWIKLKNKQDFELERFRYGAYARVGYGSFHLFGYYSLSDLFKKDQTPEGKVITPYTIGITLSAF